MSSMHCSVDALIIGGGFYGSSIAIYLAKQRRLSRVVLIEKECKLLSRASYNNQARIHNGYHYPRNFITAYRSRINFPKFVCDLPQVINKDFIKLYAIARHNSKVTAKQFVRFCKEIGANVCSADVAHRYLFESSLIEDVFIAEEYVFDATILAQWADDELKKNGIDVRLQTEATTIEKNPAGDGLSVILKSPAGEVEILDAKFVFNCTYSRLNQFRNNLLSMRATLKHEIAEMALLQVPGQLKNIGITVMDGPFFSLMPFPSRELHTLSHVRYTPHFGWEDDCGVDSYQRLSEYDRTTRSEHMIRDVGRYLPAIFEARYIDSIFEVKTVLAMNEENDGRPILFEKHINLPGCYSILGGKIDNIYDIFEKLEMEGF